MAGSVEQLDRGASLREQLGEALRAELVTGRFEPSVIYSVPSLAERFGVSATPVREAMLDLAKEGLVEAVPNKGFRLVVLSDDDLDEIAELRALVEIPVVVSLAGRLDAGDVARLREHSDAIERAAADGDLIGYIEADFRFHLDLLGLAGNRRLVELVSSLRAQSRLDNLARLAEKGVLVESAHEHALLLDALTRGDRDAVERAMSEHLGHVRGLWATTRSSTNAPNVRE